MPELTSQSIEQILRVSDRDALEQAIAGGATEVYLDLHTRTNAASRITAEDLPRVIKDAHDRNARLALALDADITQRELGQTVRLLKLASEAGCDAVLLRDPALFCVRGFFPSLEYHLDLPTSIANSADTAAALELGASRLITARQRDWSDLNGRAAEAPSSAVSKPAKPAEPKLKPYDLTIDVTEKVIVCTCRIDDRDYQWTLPKTVVHRKRKAVSIRQAFEWLKLMPIREYQLAEANTNSREFLMVPRAANALADQISLAIRQLTKPEDDTLRLDLPEELRAILAKPQRNPANQRALGDTPDRARVEARHVADFVRRVKAAGRSDAMPSAIIVEHASHDQVQRLQASSGGYPLVIALPPVFLEPDIPNIRQLVAHARSHDMAVEVNSWGGWKIAREGGARLEAGPGLAISNSLAASMLASHGCESVSIAPKLERKALEDLAAVCPVPCSITVFGRPALIITQPKSDRDQVPGRILRDERGGELRARLEHGQWTLRPLAAVDNRGLRNKNVAVAHLVVDLVGSSSPADEWLHRPSPDE